MPRKTFVAGEEALAADVNTYLMDQVVPRFATAAARDSAIPAPVAGMTCLLTGTMALQIHDGTIWLEPGKQTAIVLPGQTGVSALTNVTGSGFTLPSRLRRYLVAVHFNLFKAGAAGAVTIGIQGTGLSGLLTVGSGLMANPEGKTVSGFWSVSGATVPGGALNVTPSAGTCNIDPGSLVTVTDVGSI